MNSKDPMLLATPDNTRILFDRMSRAADGFSADQVVGAAANLLVNGIRQSYASRQQAAARFDELSAQLKTMLMDHYDSTGRKKGIFPYPQEILMSTVKFKKN